MKNKLIVTFLLLVLCAGSVTLAVKSFDDVNNHLEVASEIQTARREKIQISPTPTPTPKPVEEDIKEDIEEDVTPTPEPVDPAIPVLTFTSDTVEITAGSSFSVISVVADITDAKDDRSYLFRRIHVAGKYDVYTKGTYSLEYVVTDSDGNHSLPKILTLVVK